MGYGYYVLPDGREAGYGVDAACDHDGCGAEINRGLDYLCGTYPGEPDDGCGFYHCPDHKYDHDCRGGDVNENMSLVVQLRDGTSIVYGFVSDGLWRSTEQVDGEWLHARQVEIDGEPFIQYETPQELWTLPVDVQIV